MNLLLLEPDELTSSGEVRLSGRRLLHAREVLRAQSGERLRVGCRGGRLGTGVVQAIDDRELLLSVELSEEPPPRARIDLLLAIPRPKQLKRIIPALASLGVDTVVLVNAARVEKSYFDSKVLDDAFLGELVTQGLEQARDTVAPRLLVRERFRPFVEDELESIFHPDQRLLPHPPADRRLWALPAPAPGARVCLAIGPEGGWVPFEVELLAARGFQPFSLGPRILRTEAAVPSLIGQTLQWRASSSGA